MRVDPLLFPEEAEEKVLRADVGMVELACLRHRELENLLGARRIGKLAQSDRRLALSDRLLDTLVDLVQIHVQVRQNRRRDSLALPNQAE